MCVADVFDALTSERPYRPRMPIRQALSVIREGAGSHFDPEMVELFFKLPLSRVLGIMAHGREEPPVDLGKLSEVTLGDFYEALTKGERSPEEMLGLFERLSGGEV